MPKAAILSAVRTPIGRYGGALSSIRPDDMAALVIKAAVDRAGIDPAKIDDIYFGAANQAGEDNRNVARMAGLLAGLPVSVPGCTVNRLCASGLEAVNLGARTIEAGMADIVLVGGVESMSRAPFVLSKSEHAFTRQQTLQDTTIGWRFTNPQLHELWGSDGMGQTAEHVARKYGIDREAQDRFALWSQQKWAAADELGLFDEEIISVEIPQRKGDAILVRRDEHPRPETTLEKLAKLRPVFSSDDKGTVTAGNSSGINDGAAALVLASTDVAKSLGLEPLAVVGAAAAAGVEPKYMGIGPVAATKKCLKRAGRSFSDIDIIELNEAFAAQSVACIRELGIEEANINPKGGGIAIGHPLGCTGARLVTTLVHELRRSGGTCGLATLCIGVGQGLATLIERT